jgi:hypothetical protein
MEFQIISAAPSIRAKRTLSQMVILQINASLDLQNNSFLFIKKSQMSTLPY